MFISKDGEWTILPIILNDCELFRVICASVVNAPVVYDGPRRSGLFRVAGGYLVAHVRTPAEIERYVALTDLEEKTK